jgi:uncharacterized protein YerC
MNISLKKQLVRSLSQLISDIKTLDDAELILNDLLNNEELEGLIKKVFSAYWLKKGRDLENITRNLEISKGKANEVSEILHKKGVKLAIKYIEADEWANVWTEKIKKFSKKK